MGHHAKITIGKDAYPIVDISQKGVKFGMFVDLVEDDWEIGKHSDGTIRFLFGESIKVSGQVLRTTENDVIIYLDDDIPLKFMYDEHRYLIKNFNVDED